MFIKNRIKIYSLLLLVPILSFLILANVQIVSASTTREIKCGAFLADSPTTDNINAFESLQEKHLDVVNMFIDWNTDFSSIESNFDAVYSNGSIMSLTWEAWNLSNSDISDGLKDNYIKQMAQDMKDYNKDIIIRLFHEGNGNWYPWGLGDSTENTNDTYIAAFRHVVDIFREVGATNVKWDFNVSATNVGVGASYLGHYPGDDYVDIISIDGYNWGTTQSWGSTWQSFDEIFSDAYNALKTKNKPMAISEFASTEIGGDKAAWYTDAFTRLNSDDYSLINTVVTFSIDKETDWRINSSESALEAYIAGIHMSDSSIDEDTTPDEEDSIDSSTIPSTEDTLEIQSYNPILSDITNTISPNLRLMNTSNTSINLADIKLRYYYTINGEEDQTFNCDWSSIGSINVTGSFVKMPTAKSTADYYLEINFSNESGILNPGDSIDIIFRINKNNWSTYSQTQDYSFNSTSSTYDCFEKITAYISDNLVFGIEP